MSVGLTGGYSVEWFKFTQPSRYFGSYFGPGSSYHTGISIKIPVNEGITIQPQALLVPRQFKAKGNHSDATRYDYSFSATYIDMLVQFQYNPITSIDSRLFVFVEPFVGVGLGNKMSGYYMEDDIGMRYGDGYSETPSFKESGLSRFEYGAGLGAGFEWKRIQLQLKYDWNFNNLGDDNTRWAIEYSAWNSHCKSIFLSLILWL
ncbi:MAG: PorT family protein [Bacteroidales bacterium]|nr:PorT family protein [Bacteroidales bacterium]